MRQSMGRVGSCFYNAAAEAFFSTLGHEVLRARFHHPRPGPQDYRRPGARISTTPAVGAVPPGCKHPTTTKGRGRTAGRGMTPLKHCLNWGWFIGVREAFNCDPHTAVPDTSNPEMIWGASFGAVLPVTPDDDHAKAFRHRGLRRS